MNLSLLPLCLTSCIVVTILFIVTVWKYILPFVMIMKFFFFFFKLLTVQVTKSDPNQEPKEPKVHMVVQCVSKGGENWSAVHHMVLSFAQTTRLQAACDRKIASILALFMHHGKDEAEELHQQQYMVSNSLKTSTDLSARRVILVLP